MIVYNPQSDILRNVTAVDGRSVVFTHPFAADSSITGDYNLTIHCYQTEDLTLKGLVAYRVIKTPSGFTVYPDFDCGLVTYEAAPKGGSPVTPTANRQNGVVISPDGSTIGVQFDIIYASIDGFNVAYARGYLTATPTSAVDIKVTKATDGLTFIPVNAGGQSVTIEWGVEEIPLNILRSRQNGVEVSADGSPVDALFSNAYDSVDDYNVAYARGVLTANPIIVIDIEVTKETGKLTLIPVDANGQSVTIEWGVEFIL